jgi:flagellar biosynthesis/type III secretory pathway M-ring protein FliF/YscJ
VTTIWVFFVGVVPSLVIGLLFWWVMRKVVHADRNERAALARLDAEEAAREEKRDKDGVSS